MASRGQKQLVANPLHQLHLQTLLQTGDLGTDGRLSEVKRFGCLSEAAKSSYLKEHKELINLGSQGVT